MVNIAAVQRDGPAGFIRVTTGRFREVQNKRLKCIKLNGSKSPHGGITRYSSPIHPGKRRLTMFEKQESEDSLQEELQW
jgi:hypothetical protein